jgi:hypothetical protein
MARRPEDPPVEVGGGDRIMNESALCAYSYVVANLPDIMGYLGWVPSGKASLGVARLIA